MPNRYLRQDYLESQSVSSVSMEAEVFWVRLIVTVDDFGRVEATPALLRPKLFPLRLATVREANLVRWIAECEKANLIRLYSVRQKQYIQMMKWEKGRAKKSKCPDPPEEIARSCFLGAANSGKPPPTNVRACKHMSTDANISPDTDSDTDSDCRSLPREASGGDSSAEIPPVSLEAAISRGEEMAISKPVVEQWWHAREAIGWLRQKQPITRWQNDLVAFNASYQRNETSNTKPNGTHKGKARNVSGTTGTVNEGKSAQYRGIKSV